MLSEKEFLEENRDLTKEQALRLAYMHMQLAEVMKEHYSTLCRRFFGPRSEKINPDQLTLFNEAEYVMDHPEEENQEPEKKGKKKKGDKNSRLRSVRTETEHIYPESTVCPECGKAMQEVKPDTYEYLEYTPAQYTLHRFVVHNYTCHNCNEEKMNMTVYNGKDKLPPRLLDGSFVTPALISNIVTNKFVLGVPFYRQAKDLKNRGIEISRQVMCTWANRVSDIYLYPIWDQMRKDIRECGVTQYDETKLNCLEEKKNGRESASYAWLVMSGEFEEKQMAVYLYDATRKYGTVEKLIGEEYDGVMVSDGYGAYPSYKGTDKKAMCWAHPRRYLSDYLAGNKQLYSSYRKASEKGKEEILDQNPSFAEVMKLLNMMQKMFRYEEKYREAGYGPEEILEHRKEDMPEILESIRKQADLMESQFIPSGKVGECITYLQNQWEPLTYFMKDGRVPLTNNLAEREGIKPLVMARRNFLFADTVNGAKQSMVWFSLIISAVMNDLNPEKYLTYVLEEAARYPMTQETTERLLSYSKNLPENLKVKATSRR